MGILCHVGKLFKIESVPFIVVLLDHRLKYLLSLLIMLLSDFSFQSCEELIFCYFSVYVCIEFIEHFCYLLLAHSFRTIVLMIMVVVVVVVMVMAVIVIVIMIVRMVVVVIVVMASMSKCEGKQWESEQNLLHFNVRVIEVL